MTVSYLVYYRASSIATTIVDFPPRLHLHNSFCSDQKSIEDKRRARYCHIDAKMQTQRCRHKDARHESKRVKCSLRDRKKGEGAKVAGVIGRDAAGHVVINNSLSVIICYFVPLLYYFIFNVITMYNVIQTTLVIICFIKGLIARLATAPHTYIHGATVRRYAYMYCVIRPSLLYTPLILLRTIRAIAKSCATLYDIADLINTCSQTLVYRYSSLFLGSYSSTMTQSCVHHR